MVLNEKTSFYKACFNSMQLGILVFDNKKNIVLSNNPSAQIFGYKQSAILGKNIDELFIHSSVIDTFIDNTQSKVFKSPIELTGKKINGDVIFIELNLGEIAFEGKLYYKILFSDISLRKEKEEEISDLNAHLESELEIRNKELEKLIEQLKITLDKEKELNNLKSSFIALALHEFKTPLSAILSSTELMNKYSDLGNVNKRMEHLNKVKIMVNHLNDMLNDFLTLENIEKGMIQSSFRFFEIDYLVNQISKNTTPFLRKNQKLIIEALNKDNVYQDLKIITVILTNLLYNAIKYSGEDDSIYVTIGSTDTNILFTVKDDGIGIPENEQSFIFNRFFRAKNAMYYPGTGIGLNIAKGYVINLNGAISFESVENKGTIFRVELPKIVGYEKKSITN